MSQEALAERASVGRAYIADLERAARNPSVRTLLKIATALQVNVAELFASRNTGKPTVCRPFR
jgi:transcriptional regulator with XRE-family HTH domain